MLSRLDVTSLHTGIDCNEKPPVSPLTPEEEIRFRRLEHRLPRSVSPIEDQTINKPTRSREEAEESLIKRESVVASEEPPKQSKHESEVPMTSPLRKRAHTAFRTGSSRLLSAPPATITEEASSGIALDYKPEATVPTHEGPRRSSASAISSGSGLRRSTINGRRQRPDHLKRSQTWSFSDESTTRD